MKILKKLFAPKEVKAALGILGELELTFDCDAFQIVRKQAEGMILADQRTWVDIVRKRKSVRRLILTLVNDIAGDHAESGEYHMYRGVLHPMGPGEGFVRIYEATGEQLVRDHGFDAEHFETQRTALLKNIAEGG